MQPAESSIEEVPFCFFGSSIKFQGHTGWKIDDLNPIWVRLICRSQLSNPADLPCYFAHVYLCAVCVVNACLKVWFSCANWTLVENCFLYLQGIAPHRKHLNKKSNHFIPIISMIQGVLVSIDFYLFCLSCERQNDANSCMICLPRFTR